MAIKPITVTKILLILPRYFFSDSIFLIAYIGMINKIIAITGPEKVSIMLSTLGLMTAAYHTDINNIAMVSLLASLGVILVCLVIMPFRLSRPPRK